MKALRSWATRPVATGLLASLPLWIVFGNYVVALAVGLLSALMLSMCVQLLALRRREPDPPSSAHRTTPDDPS